MKKNNHKQIIADPEEAEISPVKELVKEEAMVYASPIGFIQINGVVYTTEANPTNQVEYITSIRFFDTDPGATETASPTLKKAWEQIKAYFETGLKEFSFPILQPGTHFQMAVWKELMDIPYGKTISYLQLAQKLGDTKKIRAAGSANGKNNIAIVVPCHRVIGSTGELVGYAGSLWRKEWLLIHEGVLPKKLF